MTLLSSHLRRLVTALVTLTVLAGCASSDLEQAAKAQLTKAQTAYRQAQSQPDDHPRGPSDGRDPKLD